MGLYEMENLLNKCVSVCVCVCVSVSLYAVSVIKRYLYNNPMGLGTRGAVFESIETSLLFVPRYSAGLQVSGGAG